MRYPNIKKEKSIEKVGRELFLIELFLFIKFMTDQNKSSRSTIQILFDIMERYEAKYGPIQILSDTEIESLSINTASTKSSNADRFSSFEANDQKSSQPPALDKVTNLFRNSSKAG